MSLSNVGLGFGPNLFSCVPRSPRLAALFTATLLIAAAGLAPAQTFSYTGPSVPVPDNTTVDVPLVVSGLTGPITDLNVSFDGSACTTTYPSTTVGIAHSWVGDLNITLIAPNGTSAMIVNRMGTNGNQQGNNFCNTVLDDSATNPIDTAAVAPFTGSFTPQNPLAAFNAMSPAVANGTWTLRVQDAATNDPGDVHAWSLHFVATNGPILTVDDITIAEGDSGTQNADFVLSLDPVPTVAGSIDIMTTGGFAEAGADYVGLPLQSLVIPAFAATVPVTVAIDSDVYFEGNETFNLVCSNPSSGLTIGDGVATATIQDNDIAPLGFAIDVSLGSERFVTFPLDDSSNVNEVAPTPSQVALYLGGDFAGNDRTRFYYWDDDAGTFNVVETATGVATAISGPQTPANGDDDWHGLSWDSTTGTMYALSSDAFDSTSTIYTVNMLTGVASPIALVVPPIDYNTAIAIHPMTGQMYALDLTSDSLYTINKTTGASALVGALGVGISFSQDMDFDEYGQLFLASMDFSAGPRLCRLNPATGAAMVLGDIGVGGQYAAFGIFPSIPPGTTAISIDDLSAVTENDSGTQTLTFTVTANPPSTSALAMDLSFLGTATNAVDFNGAVGPLSIAANASTTTFDIVVSGDTNYEGNERVRAVIKNVTGGTAAFFDQTGDVLIMNDDPIGDGFGIGVSPDRVAAFNVNDAATLLEFAPTDGYFIGADFAPAGLPSDRDTVYLCESINKNIWRADAATGQMTLVGPMGGAVLPSYFTSGLAWDATTNTMWMSAGAVPTDLFTVNLTTGACSYETSVSGFTFDNIGGIAIHPTTGQMYGIDLWNDRLVRINKVTGAATEVGPLGISSGGAYMEMDFDDATGTLYLAANVDNGPGLPISSELHTINLATGAATLLGGIGDGTDRFTSWAFAPEYVGPTAAADWNLFE